MNSVAEAFPIPAYRMNSFMGLVEIFETECQIAVARRAPISTIDTYLATTSKQMGEGFRIVLTQGESLPLHLLPEAEGKNDFATDIMCLTEVYRDLLGCPAIGLRLEVLDRAMCPRFHVDNTGIRLLCTYNGPGTEWLDDEAADRSKLGPAIASLQHKDEDVVLDPLGIHRVEPYAIALLKGSGWQGNAGRGLIHRSPAVQENAAPRVLLALDALW